MSDYITSPEVKICGITNLEDAAACVDADLDCIGFVFYPKSARAITPEWAGQIAKAFPSILFAGVFVDRDQYDIAEIAKTARLDILQLHGKEDVQYIAQLQKLIDLPIIKCLYLKDYPDISLLQEYQDLCRGVLIEAEKTTLPGGNGLKWDYSLLKKFSGRHDIIVAGGINPENFTDAIKQSGCSAFDISSGVEQSKGRKDHEKIAAIGKYKQQCNISIHNKNRRIFR